MVAASATPASEDVRIVNTVGTDNAAIALTATAGGITATVADEKELKLGNADGDAYFMVAASATDGNEDVRIVNTQGTDAAAIALTATAGGIDINAGLAIDINSSGGVISIGNDAVAQNMNIGTGAAARTIAIGNDTGATAITVTSGSGGITMTTGTNGGISIDPNGTGDLTLGSADNTTTSLNGNAMDIDAEGALQINSSGGVISIGNDDVAQDMNIGTGAAERTIAIGNTSGATAVNIDAGTGGVSLDAAGGSNFTTSAGALTLTSAAASTWSCSAGVLTLSGADGVKVNAKFGLGVDPVAKQTGVGVFSGTAAGSAATGTAADDIASLRAKLNTVIEALQAFGLCD